MGTSSSKVAARAGKLLGPVVGVALLAAASQPASAWVIDFEFLTNGFSAGDIVNTQLDGANGIFGSAAGVEIGATNLGGGPNLAVIFDTNNVIGGFSGADDDLGAPFANQPANPGHVLIIQEHSSSCTSTNCSYPDDEGSRPAGVIDFEFTKPIFFESLDFLDIELAENGTTANNAIRLFDKDDNEISAGTYYTPHTGNNGWGQVIFNESFVQRVEVHMGGSGAIDNFKGDVVPEPAALGLLGLGLLGLGFMSRWRRRAA